MNSNNGNLTLSYTLKPLNGAQNGILFTILATNLVVKCRMGGRGMWGVYLQPLGRRYREGTAQTRGVRRGVLREA